MEPAPPAPEQPIAQAEEQSRASSLTPGTSSPKCCGGFPNRTCETGVSARSAIPAPRWRLPSWVRRPFLRYSGGGLQIPRVECASGESRDPSSLAPPALSYHLIYVFATGCHLSVPGGSGGGAGRPPIFFPSLWHDTRA